MSNLIINGIDHSVFDLEWAKRGGIVHILDDGIEPNIEYLCLVVPKFDDLLVMILQSGNYSFFFSEFTSKKIMRMATPAECAEAGIEYIEPPAMWRNIESAPTSGDVELLVWNELEEQCFVAYHADDDSWNVLGDDVYKNTKESPLTLWMPKPQPPKDE